MICNNKANKNHPSIRDERTAQF